MKNTAKKVILYLGLTLFLAGLGLFLYLGHYNRYWADDWCYNADFKIKGFVETVQGYTSDVTYTPSRFAVTIFAGLVNAFGVLGLQLMTQLTIIFWVAGLVFLFYNIVRLVDYRLPMPAIIMASAAIVYFSIYLTPHIYQSIYWRTGALTYTTPLVFITWIFALITAQGVCDNPSPALTALIGALAFFGGGFSEASCTVLVSTLTMYLFLAGIGYRNKRPWAVNSFTPTLLALLGALAAMALLIFAPTTQIRRQRYGEPTELFRLPGLILRYTYGFFVLSAKDYNNLLLIALSLLSGFIFFPPQAKPGKPVKALLLAVLTGLLSIILVAASLTPSIYVERGLPAARTMIVPRFVAAFAFVLGGWLSGLFLKQVIKVKWAESLALVLLLVSFSYPIYTLKVTAEKISIYAGRAQEWDLRTSTIQSALANGQSRVDVLAIDGLPVGGIRDFDPKEKKGYWITRCAMDYYGIKLDVSFP